MWEQRRKGAGEQGSKKGAGVAILLWGMIKPVAELAAFLAMSPAELLSRYTIGIERFDRRVVTLNDEQLDMAFLPDANVGRWPVRVLLGHLADAELAFVFRMRLVVAEDHPVLTPWDENAFIDNGLYTAKIRRESAGLGPAAERMPVTQSIGGPMATIHTLRKWHAEFLRTLTDAQWERKGLHPQRGEQTVKTILGYDTWHLEHHAAFLNAKVEKFLGAGK